jgi:hypothetical protein
MRTVTEFPGVVLRQVVAKKKELEAAQPRSTQPRPPIAIATPPITPSDESPTSVETTDGGAEASVSASPPKQSPEQSTNQESSAAENASPSSDATSSEDTAEDGNQITVALGTHFKLEGERLNHLVAAIDLVSSKIHTISRVRVFAGDDETKMPKGVTKVGEHYYLVEYLPVPPKPDRGRHQGGKHGKRGDKKGKRRGKGRGGDRRDQRNATSKDGTPAADEQKPEFKGHRPWKGKPRNDNRQGDQRQGPPPQTTTASAVTPLATQNTAEKTVTSNS